VLASRNYIIGFEARFRCEAKSELPCYAPMLPAGREADAQELIQREISLESLLTFERYKAIDLCHHLQNGTLQDLSASGRIRVDFNFITSSIRAADAPEGVTLFVHSHRRLNRAESA
jgi:hypothetical protein